MLPSSASAMIVPVDLFGVMAMLHSPSTLLAFHQALVRRKYRRLFSLSQCSNETPVWTLGLLLVAIVSGAAIGEYRYATIWTPLQRLYLASYLRSECTGALAFKTGRYRLLTLIDPKRSRLALDEWRGTAERSS
jgi:hypothetical protein